MSEMDFLRVKDKTFLITGVGNKKSIATFTARGLLDAGAKIILTVANEEALTQAAKLFPDCEALLCNVERHEEIVSLGAKLQERGVRLAGLLHSIAFANYSEGMKPFYDTKWPDFTQAINISCYSLIALSRELLPCFETGASVVALSISNTRATSYGYMGPIKAMLNSSVDFLAKSLSENGVRVNALCAGPLKTSASAGIPGYIDNYLFAEQLTLRKKALETSEVADTALFLLSSRSSGVNAASLVVDAGMAVNGFDESVVKAFSERK
jgi:enoyl-[acyl-carrier protein] reductase I